MLKPICLTLTLCLCVFAAIAQVNQTLPAKGDTAVPASAAQQPNPVKPTAESLAVGKKYYGYDCAMCHGANGDGKGEVAVAEKQKLSDLRDPATLQDKTDGELHYIIKSGRGQMPPEGDRLKGNDLWSLVNYIRSLAKK